MNQPYVNSTQNQLDLSLSAKFIQMAQSPSERVQGHINESISVASNPTIAGKKIIILIITTPIIATINFIIL